MTGKQKLELILSGGVPDTPPHWELVFQIQKEMFGMDRSAVAKEDRPAFDLDVLHRVVDEFGWAAVRGVFSIRSAAYEKRLFTVSQVADRGLLRRCVLHFYRLRIFDGARQHGRQKRGSRRGDRPWRGGAWR